MLKKLIILSILLFWPLNLFLHNNISIFITYLLPAIFLGISYFYFKHSRLWYLVPILFIPAVSPKLVLLPIFFYLLAFIHFKRTALLILLVLSCLFLAVRYPNFRGQTIVNKDYEAEQLVIREQQLYGTVFMARVFHNKARIISDKAIVNSFILIDPNNYFFGNAPRQVPADNQNLQKYPFLALPFLIFSLINIRNLKYKSFLVITSASIFLSLLILKIFDGHDFLLYIPISMLLIYGLNILDEKFKRPEPYYVIYLVITVWEFVRLFYK